MEDDFSRAIGRMVKNERELSFAAAQAYNVFKSFVDAGFTEEQAIQMLIGMIRPNQQE